MTLTVKTAPSELGRRFQPFISAWHLLILKYISKNIMTKHVNKLWPVERQTELTIAAHKLRDKRARVEYINT